MPTGPTAVRPAKLQSNRHYQQTNTHDRDYNLAHSKNLLSLVSSFIKIGPLVFARQLYPRTCENTAFSASMIMKVSKLCLKVNQLTCSSDLKGSLKEPNISIYFFFPPISQSCSVSDVLFTGGRGVSDFSVLKYY